jgi:hypothetical protein
MAGTILIAEEKVLATSTNDFDYLVERIRHSFLPEDASFLSEIYDPLDTGGMTFISLIEQEAVGFNAFVRTSKRAYHKATIEETFWKRKELWDELLNMLKADPRYADIDM